MLFAYITLNNMRMRRFSRLSQIVLLEDQVLLIRGLQSRRFGTTHRLQFFTRMPYFPSHPDRAW